MKLRAPEPHEAPALTDLVRRSRASHGYDAEFMAIFADVLTVHPEAWGVPLLAEGDQILGYVELQPETARIEHRLIAPEAQGQGVGL
ncbi:MAG: hypothetical protein MK180_12235 [Rhodobacteraceae bacterium]|nr:hypothetical protein [Paracoccaceae bacterium]